MLDGNDAASMHHCELVLFAINLSVSSYVTKLVDIQQVVQIPRNQ